MQEPNHGENVASLPLVLGVHRVHGTANKNPEWPLQVIRTQGFRLLLEHPLLLVE